MIDDVKPKQREAIISYVSGNDTFVVLPMRYGKSLIYALLPLIYNSISPRHGCLAHFQYLSCLRTPVYCGGVNQ